jgi:hypothetical protein
MLEDAVEFINEIFIRDLAIQLTLVGGSSLIFVDSETDGLTDGDENILFTEGTAVIDAAIGNESYDIGHIIGVNPSDSTASGIHQLGSVGVHSRKGQGATIAGETILKSVRESLFSVLAHELGHGFGAPHTFNFDDEFRFEDAAYEGGAGCTLMSYGARCDTLLATDPNVEFFHSSNIEQINEVIRRDPTISRDSSPHRTIETGNAIPIVDATPHDGLAPTSITSNSVTSDSTAAHYVIPTGTSFILEAIGTDSDNDDLTYTWDQLDLGPVQNFPLSGSVLDGPLFRTLQPSTSQVRSFPNLSDVLEGIDSAAIGEVLPTVERDLDFRVTVRDGKGGVNSDDIKLRVIDTGESFHLEPLPTMLQGGEQLQVDWVVAGTDGNGIDVNQVAIELSRDGGFTFPIVLRSSTPNTGSATVLLPNVDISSARIRIRALDHIIFDISDQLTIQRSSLNNGLVLNRPESHEGFIESFQTDYRYEAFLQWNDEDAFEPIVVDFQVDGQSEISVNGSDFAQRVEHEFQSANELGLVDVIVRPVNDDLNEGLHNTVIDHIARQWPGIDSTGELLLDTIIIQIADDELPPLAGIDFGRPLSSDAENDFLTVSNFFESSTNLIREDGSSTAISVSLGRPDGTYTSGGSLLLAETLPSHNPSLSAVNGFVDFPAGGTASIEFGNLDPRFDYGIYVLASASDEFALNNQVRIVGEQTIDFVQQAPVALEGGFLRPRSVVINSEQGNDTLPITHYRVTVRPNREGRIEVSVSAAAGTAMARLLGVLIEPPLAPASALSIELSDVSVSEGATEGTLNATISRSGALNEAVSGYIRPNESNVISEVPFSFEEGQASTRVSIPTIDDFFVESDQEVSLTATAFGYLRAVADVTVRDDDEPSFTFDQDVYTVNEGIGGAFVTITRNFTEATELEFRAAVENTITLTQPIVSFGEGQLTSQVRVRGTNNQLFTGTKTHTVNAFRNEELVKSFEVEVLDDEVHDIRLSVESTAVAENSGQLSLTISRNSNFPIELSLSADKDNQLSFPSTIEFSENEQSKTIAVDVLDDDIASGSRDVLLALAMDGEVMSSQNIHIREDDLWGMSFTTESVQVSEGDGPFSIELTRNTLHETVVFLSTQSSGQLNFPESIPFSEGQLSASFNIHPIDDDLLTGERDISLQARHDGSLGELFPVIANLDVKITEDEEAGILLTESFDSSFIGLAGVDDSIMVRLSSKPLSTVRVVAEYQTAEGGTAIASSVEVAPSSWSDLTQLDLPSLDDGYESTSAPSQIQLSIRLDTTAFGFVDLPAKNIGLKIVRSSDALEVHRSDESLQLRRSADGLVLRASSNDESSFRLVSGSFSETIEVSLGLLNGNDVEVDAAEGDDVFLVTDTSDTPSATLSLNGNSGFDTVRLDDGIRILEMNSLSLDSIERIDLRNDSAVRFQIDLDTLISIDSPVQVLSDNDDVVGLSDGFVPGDPVMQPEFFHRLVNGNTEVHWSNGRNWTNPITPFDVNADGSVSALDALIIINRLNRQTTQVLPAPTEQADFAYYDVTVDGNATALDALQVINALNRASSNVVGSEPAGEAAFIPITASLKPSYVKIRDGDSIVVDDQRTTYPASQHKMQLEPTETWTNRDPVACNTRLDSGEEGLKASELQILEKSEDFDDSLRVANLDDAFKTWAI